MPRRKAGRHKKYVYALYTQNLCAKTDDIKRPVAYIDVNRNPEAKTNTSDYTAF